MAITSPNRSVRIRPKIASNPPLRKAGTETLNWKYKAATVTIHLIINTRGSVLRLSARMNSQPIKPRMAMSERMFTTICRI